MYNFFKYVWWERQNRMVEVTKSSRYDWFDLIKRSGSKSMMSYAVAMVDPGGEFPKHMHYGTEQLVYILEGEGYVYINDVAHPAYPGAAFFFESGDSHRTVNTGDITLKELDISIPAVQDVPAFAEDNAQGIDYTENLYNAVRALEKQIAENLSTPIVVFDSDWKEVYRGDKWPQICREKCMQGGEGSCYCLEEHPELGLEKSEASEFVCPYGLTVYHYPIRFMNNDIGAVRGGCIIELGHDSMLEGKESLIPDHASSPPGIKHQLHHITRNIISFCQYVSLRNEAINMQLELEASEHELMMLNDDLHDTQYSVTDLKINHHFLFNTLNMIARMALDEPREKVYDVIVDLSEMFRRSMMTDVKTVPLRSEIEYLDLYIEMQQLRFRDSLTVEFDRDPAADEVPVPFNFLQPLVENAFKHGLAPMRDEDKWLGIVIRKAGQWVEIYVKNNGAVLDDQTIDHINVMLRQHSGHGLSLIHEKLQIAYGNRFVFRFLKSEEKKTVVAIKIPTNMEKEDRETE